MTSTVKVGSLSCKIWKCSDGVYRWHYFSGGRRKTASAVNQDKARQRAKAALESLKTGTSEIAALDPSEISLFLKWKKSQQSSIKVADAVALFMETRKELSHVYRRTMKADLNRFAEASTGTIAEVTSSDIDRFLDTINAGPRRRNNVRGSLVALFRWARRRKYVADATTAPEYVEKVKEVSAEAAVFTPDQLRRILVASGDTWRPALAIQAFSGIRTEELSRLTWADVNVNKRIITVSAEASKTGRKRLVPIHDNLASFIPSRTKPSAPIAPAEGLDPLVKRLSRQKIKWVKNGLRHSYGSYRCAITADPSRVAFEMGNSPAMVMAHYNNAQELSTALDWFSIECNQIVTSEPSQLKAA